METTVGWAFHHKRMLLAAGAALILFTLVLTRPATITGHFFAETYDQRTDLSATESAAYALNGAQLTHLQVSGMIDGSGEVRIYLDEGISRKLVYTNARTADNRITGAATTSEASAATIPKLTIQELEPELPALERPGTPRTLPAAFNRACIETCILNPTPGSTYKLLVQTEPGTTVTIQALHFSSVELGTPS